tara:strand:+ start:2953 stop:3147 length:195 start_codon:yes stop_codon:yes gene_type:complete
MNTNTENALHLIAGTMLLGFAVLGVIAAGTMEQQYGAFCSQAWVAGTFAAFAAMAGAASFLNIR